jgi:hypothetical protein
LYDSDVKGKIPRQPMVQLRHSSRSWTECDFVKLSLALPASPSPARATRKSRWSTRGRGVRGPGRSESATICRCRPVCGLGRCVRRCRVGCWGWTSFYSGSGSGAARRSAIRRGRLQVGRRRVRRRLMTILSCQRICTAADACGHHQRFIGVLPSARPAQPRLGQIIDHKSTVAAYIKPEFDKPVR